MSEWGGRIPLFVGVTGHPDLHLAQVPAITHQLQAFIDELRAQVPSTPIVFLSSLDEGAEQMVASVAADSGCELACVLPLEREAYRAGLRTSSARAEFDRLVAASTVLELPERPGTSMSAEQARASAGHYIARHSTILIALWDGVPSRRPGSTADVVRMRTSIWVGPEAGAFCHLRVRRCEGEIDPGSERGDGERAAAENDAEPGQLPTAAAAVHHCGWNHVDEFNRAALAGGQRIAATGPAKPFGLFDAPRFSQVAATLSAASLLAADAQRAVTRRKLLLHVVAFLAAIAFVVIFKTSGARWLLWLYLGLLAAALTLRTLTTRQAIHRRYLDYRCLTEGLRVVLFWRLAGLPGDPGAHTVTIRLISRQDPSLMWVAAALSGLAGWIGRVDVPPGFDGYDFARHHWLGSDSSDEEGAQIPYYRRAANRRRRVARRLDRISRISLVVGVGTAAALALLPAGWIGQGVPVLLGVMGFLPLVSSTVASIADLPAELGIARQYDAMADLLESAGRRLAAADSDVERRQILFEAGAAALAEHSFWHAVFRERAPERRIRAG